jgi:uncharacterized FlaG/YvyC family protein
MDVSAVTSADVASPQTSGVSPAVAAQRRQLVQAGRAVNESGLLGSNQIVFSVDSQTHRPIIRIEDPVTHEVVLQIPPEYLLRLAQDLGAKSSETESGSADR